MVTAAGLVVLAAAAPVRAADPVNIKPGLWETQVQVEMQGLASGVPPQSFQNCVKPEDVSDPQKAMAMQEQRSHCSFSDQRYVGNQYSYTMTCGQAMTAKGQVHFMGDRFEGHVVSTMQAAGGMTMNSTIRGRRLGDCKG
jgi:hypothetical protein